jgi:hypothetical protein
VGPSGQREKERGGAPGLRELAGSAHAREKRERGVLGLGIGLGHGKERGERARERGRERGFGLVAGLLLSFLSFSPFLFLFYTQPFKQIYLNSNKFEFKPYKLN